MGELIRQHGEQSRSEVILQKTVSQGRAEEVEAHHGLGAPQKGVGHGQHSDGGEESREKIPAQHRNQRAHGIAQEGEGHEAEQVHAHVLHRDAVGILPESGHFHAVGHKDGDHDAQRDGYKAEEVAEEELLPPRRAHRQVGDGFTAAPQEGEQDKGGEQTVDHPRDTQGDLGVPHDEGELIGAVALQTCGHKGKGEEEQESHEGHPPVAAGRPQDLMEQGAAFTLWCQRVLRRHSSFLPSSFHT